MMEIEPMSGTEIKSASFQYLKDGVRAGSPNSKKNNDKFEFESEGPMEFNIDHMNNYH